MSCVRVCLEASQHSQFLSFRLCTFSNYYVVPNARFLSGLWLKPLPFADTHNRKEQVPLKKREPSQNFMLTLKPGNFVVVHLPSPEDQIP